MGHADANRGCGMSEQEIGASSEVPMQRGELRALEASKVSEPTDGDDPPRCPDCDQVVSREGQTCWTALGEDS